MLFHSIWPEISLASFQTLGHTLTSFILSSCQHITYICMFCMSGNTLTSKTTETSENLFRITFSSRDATREKGDVHRHFWPVVGWKCHGNGGALFQLKRCPHKSNDLSSRKFESSSSPSSYWKTVLSERRIRRLNMLWRCWSYFTRAYWNYRYS